MSCFDIDVWVDYSRNLLPESVAASLVAHLESGCQACAVTAQFAHEVVSAAREAMRGCPPPDVVARAKALFVPKQKRRSVLTLLAELVSPGLGEPLPAGFRGGVRDGEHILYRADRYFIDLRFETRSDSVRVYLMGQVADGSVPEPLAAGDAPISVVSLLNGGRLIAETVSNEFGEFCLDYLPEKDLKLVLDLTNSSEQIEIPIEVQ